MSNLKFYSFNLAIQASTVITPVSVNAQFPAGNIKDPRSTKVHRTATGVLTNNVVFDMITIEDVSAVLTVPNFQTGFSGISGDIIIEANPTDSWGAPALSTTLTPNDEFGFGFKLFSTDEQYRFWRLTFTNTADFAEISKVFIGKDVMRTITANNIDFGWTKQTVDNSKFRRNRYKQRFTDEINTTDIYKFSYNLLNKTEYDLIVNALDEVGEKTPFWMIVDSDATIINDAERFAGAFYLRSKPVITNPHFGLYNLSFTAESSN